MDRPRPTAGLAAAALVATSVLGLAFTKITSPDLGFLIATGRAVRALGRIPATNVLSFAEPDHPWLLHEWIPALIFEAGWRGAGPAGVLAVKAAVLVATWSLVLGAARRLGASPLVAAFATLLGAGAAALRFTERPQIFSNLGLALVLYLLARARRDRARRRGFVVAAGLAAAFTAQVHAGALTSFSLLGAASLGLAIEGARTRDRGLVGDAAKLAAVTGGSVALAALALATYHPHGARPLLVPFDLALDATLREHVVEYRSPLRFPPLDLRAYWLLLALASAAALLAAIRVVRRSPAAVSTETPIDAAVALALMMLGALSLRHVRAVDSFAIVAAPAIAASATEALDAGKRVVPRAAWAVVLALAIALPLDHWRAFPPGAGLVEAVWPARLLAFVAREEIVGPAFVSDGWAGPFLGERYPRERAFFDPRFEAYSPAMVRTYQHLRDGDEGYADTLDRYRIQLVMLKYTTAGEARGRAGRESLRQRLARDPAWALVGFGDTGEVFVRRDGPNAAIAARFEIPEVDPDRGVFLGDPTRAALALVRAVDAGFGDARVLALGAVAVAASGKPDLARRMLDRAEAQNASDPLVVRAREAISAAPR